MSGELDMATAPCLGDHLGGLIDAGTAEVTLDLVRLDFIDSTGLHVLVSALKRLRANGGDLVLRGVSTRATKVFELTGLAGIFRPTDDPERPDRVPSAATTAGSVLGQAALPTEDRPWTVCSITLPYKRPIFEERAIIRRSPSQPGGQLGLTFTIIGNGLADPVAVVGDFNDWDPVATVMSRRGETRQASVVLQEGWRYAFRYLAGGERWFNDEAADDYQPNDFGGCDSVLDLTAP